MPMNLQRLKDPYVITSILFLIIVLAGRFFWGWSERELSFLLLLYFIVAIGIKLDEIARQLSSLNECVARSSAVRTNLPAQPSPRTEPAGGLRPAEESVVQGLEAVRASLSSIHETLLRIRDAVEEKRPDSPP